MDSRTTGIGITDPYDGEPAAAIGDAQAIALQLIALKYSYSRSAFDRLAPDLRTTALRLLRRVDSAILKQTKNAARCIKKPGKKVSPPRDASIDIRRIHPHHLDDAAGQKDLTNHKSPPACTRSTSRHSSSSPMNSRLSRSGSSTNSSGTKNDALPVRHAGRYPSPLPRQSPRYLRPTYSWVQRERAALQEAPRGSLLDAIAVGVVEGKALKKVLSFKEEAGPGRRARVGSASTSAGADPSGFSGLPSVASRADGHDDAVSVDLDNIGLDSVIEEYGLNKDDDDFGGGVEDDDAERESPKSHLDPALVAAMIADIVSDPVTKETAGELLRQAECDAVEADRERDIILMGRRGVGHGGGSANIYLPPRVFFSSARSSADVDLEEVLGHRHVDLQTDAPSQADAVSLEELACGPSVEIGKPPAGDGARTMAEASSVPCVTVNGHSAASYAPTRRTRPSSKPKPKPSPPPQPVRHPAPEIYREGSPDQIAESQQRRPSLAGRRRSGDLLEPTDSDEVLPIRVGHDGNLDRDHVDEMDEHDAVSGGVCESYHLLEDEADDEYRDIVTPLVPSPLSKAARSHDVRKKLKKRYSFRVAQALYLASGGQQDSLAAKIAKLREEHASSILEMDIPSSTISVAGERRVGTLIDDASSEGGSVSSGADIAAGSCAPECVVLDVGSMHTRACIAGAKYPGFICASVIDADGYDSTASMGMGMLSGSTAYDRWSFTPDDDAMQRRFWPIQGGVVLDYDRWQSLAHRSIRAVHPSESSGPPAVLVVENGAALSYDTKAGASMHASCAEHLLESGSAGHVCFRSSLAMSLAAQGRSDGFAVEASHSGISGGLVEGGRVVRSSLVRSDVGGAAIDIVLAQQLRAAGSRMAQWWDLRAYHAPLKSAGLVTIPTPVADLSRSAEFNALWIARAMREAPVLANRAMGSFVSGAGFECDDTGEVERAGVVLLPNGACLLQPLHSNPDHDDHHATCVAAASGATGKLQTTLRGCYASEAAQLLAYALDRTVLAGANHSGSETEGIVGLLIRLMKASECGATDDDDARATEERRKGGVSTRSHLPPSIRRLMLADCVFCGGLSSLPELAGVATNALHKHAIAGTLRWEDDDVSEDLWTVASELSLSTGTAINIDGDRQFSYASVLGHVSPEDAGMEFSPMFSPCTVVSQAELHQASRKALLGIPAPGGSRGAYLRMRRRFPGLEWMSAWQEQPAPCGQFDALVGGSVLAGVGALSVEAGDFIDKSVWDETGEALFTSLEWVGCKAE